MSVLDDNKFNFVVTDLIPKLQKELNCSHLGLIGWSLRVREDIAKCKGLDSAWTSIEWDDFIDKLNSYKEIKNENTKILEDLLKIVKIP